MEESAFSKVDLFISRKSNDARRAKKLYNFFKEKGLVVFESDEMLKRAGQSDYGRAIDEALNSTKHFIVFVSKSRYFSESSWVDKEWRYFRNRQMMGHAKGNLMVVLTPNVDIKEIPEVLQHYQVFYYENRTAFFESLLTFAGKEAPKIIPPRKPPPYRQKWFLFTMLILGVITCTTLIIGGLQSQQPFDMTVFVKPDPQVKLHPDYPKFTGGKLSIFIEDKEEKADVDAKGEITIKHISAAYRGDIVPIRFSSKKWRLTEDSMKLGKNAQLFLVPDGSLAAVKGTVVSYTQRLPLDSAKITLGAGDTFFYSNKSGFFNVTLPYRLQQDSFYLCIEKPGYERTVEKYFPQSQEVFIFLKSR
jgi:TIR domain